MRNISLAEGELYHIYNRGVDKRDIFADRKDLDRFFSSVEQFNTSNIVGNLGRRHGVSTEPKLVEILAYCANANHFHFILKQASEKGIQKFMHKLSMGYAKFFNTKYKRRGALFQGMFGAKHIDTNEYLLHLSAYVNLNDLAHGRGHGVSTLGKTSWEEYVGNVPDGLCKTEIILEQFESKDKYKEFAEDALKNIMEKKILLEELQ